VAVVAAGDASGRATMSDGRPEMTQVARLAWSRPPRAGRTCVVAVDGRSGAGKTSFATALQAALGAPVVALEYLYGGWDGLERGVDVLVSAVLEPIAHGRAARVPRYDWSAAGWGTPWTLEPPEILIVEGVGAGARRAAALESVLIWMEEPALVRKKRALDRDGDTFAPYWDTWAAQEDAMLARERTPERADLILRLGHVALGRL
jgi:uridine kinase